MTFTIGADGALASLSYDANLSGIFAALFDPDTGLDLGSTADEMAQAGQMFADTTWILQVANTFALDDTIVVTPPTGDFEDRTELARTYLTDVTSA